MPGIYPVPDEKKIHDILTMLYGNDVTLDSCDATPIENDKNMLAVFIDDEGKPSTACACNYNFAAFAGAALTKIPVGGAEDAAESGDFSDMMLSNLYEVMNICSRMFMNDTSPHIKLDKVYKTFDEAPDNVRDAFQDTEERIDFDVSIPGYGNGAITFMCS
jgi:hypothetical protein